MAALGLGLVALSEDRLKDAEEKFLEALSLQEESYGKDHPDIAFATLSLANVHRRQGRAQNAEVGFKRALELRAATVASARPLFRRTVKDYASFLIEQERATDVRALLERFELTESELGI